MAALIGTSGWSYDHWHPELYPPGLPARDRLALYTQVFTTAELNSRFYRWPSPAAFASWRRRLPDGFRLSVKAPRGLTHERSFTGRRRGWSASRRAGTSWMAAGRCCWCSCRPPRPVTITRLDYFLARVPGWMRVAVEFRHPSWHREEVFALLAAHRAAYCVMSGANLPCMLRATTDFVYVRMHGPDREHLYAGSYRGRRPALVGGPDRRVGPGGKDVFVYFNNDGKANAVRNARTLPGPVGPATAPCPRPARCGG